jgi:predicted O-methyltransferase YrrM
MDVIEFLKELKKFGLENEIPNISETNAKFIRDLIKISKSKNMLEI